MIKETMVAVLSGHDEIYWDHTHKVACCDGCDAVLSKLGEGHDDLPYQVGKLKEHQADELLRAGMGLLREAWEVGMADAKLQALGIKPRVRNPYVED